MLSLAVCRYFVLLAVKCAKQALVKEEMVVKEESDASDDYHSTSLNGHIVHVPVYNSQTRCTLQFRDGTDLQMLINALRRNDIDTM